MLTRFSNADKNDVLEDCKETLRMPVLINSLVEILNGTITFVIANEVGKFTDQLLTNPAEIVMGKIGVLIICMLIISVIIPFVSLAGDYVLFKGALKHDGLVFGHFMKKEPYTVMLSATGEQQYIMVP